MGTLRGAVPFRDRYFRCTEPECKAIGMSSITVFLSNEDGEKLQLVGCRARLVDLTC